MWFVSGPAGCVLLCLDLQTILIIIIITIKGACNLSVFRVDIVIVIIHSVIFFCWWRMIHLFDFDLEVFPVISIIISVALFPPYFVCCELVKPRVNGGACIASVHPTRLRPANCKPRTNQKIEKCSRWEKIISTRSNTKWLASWNKTKNVHTRFVSNRRLFLESLQHAPKF